MDQPGRFEDASLDVERHKVAALVAMLEAEGFREDDDMVLDAIEGQTNALEAVSGVLRLIGEDEARIASLKELTGMYGARKARYEERVKNARRTLLNFMQEFNIPRIERPEATLSMSVGGAKIGYLGDMDPTKLPAQFQRVTVDADKTAIAEAMKADPDLTLPGVYRTNGGVTLTVRRR